MHFKDIGIIISKKAFKENALIISAFTKNHGLYSGVITNPSKKTQVSYMEGNLVDFFWKARLVDHLGTVKCDLIKSYAGFLLTDKLKLFAFNSIVSLIKIAFCEREPHNNLFPVLKDYLDKSNLAFNFKDYINLELAILSEAGYGLTLNSCAVTGAKENLYYVSPKSGKAVSYEEGKAYNSKLLKLPKILAGSGVLPVYLDVKECFDLTGYFLNRYFFNGRPQSPERTNLYNAIIEYINKS